MKILHTWNHKILQKVIFKYNFCDNKLDSIVLSEKFSPNVLSVSPTLRRPTDSAVLILARHDPGL